MLSECKYKALKSETLTREIKIKKLPSTKRNKLDVVQGEILATAFQ